MRPILLLARKDFRTLIRSRALLLCLLVYPLIIAALLGAMLLNANQGATIALVDEDTTGKVLRLGGDKFGVDEYRRQAESSGVEIREMRMPAAQHALDEGQVSGILVIPQGFMAKLQTALSPGEVEFHTGNNALGYTITERVQGVIYRINLKISRALIKENSTYLKRLVTGGQVTVVGDTYDLYGLEPARRDLEDVRDQVDDAEAQETIDDVIDFAGSAGSAIGLADNALEATAAPVRLKHVRSTGKSPQLTARAMSFALAVTLALICVTLVAASLAAERDERVLGRLLRSGARPVHILVAKLLLGAGLSTLFSLGLFITFAVLAPQAWSRLPLLLVCVALASFALATLGTLVAVLARDARTSTLVALLVVLPLIPLALVSGTGPLALVSQALPIAPSMDLFNTVLYEPHPYTAIARGLGHLAVIAAALGGASLRLIRRLT